MRILIITMIITTIIIIIVIIILIAILGLNNYVKKQQREIVDCHTYNRRQWRQRNTKWVQKEEKEWKENTVGTKTV